MGFALTHTRTHTQPKPFTFDQVYDHTTKQEFLFETTAQPIIDCVIQVYCSVCVAVCVLRCVCCIAIVAVSVLFQPVFDCIILVC